MCFHPLLGGDGAGVVGGGGGADADAEAVAVFGRPREARGWAQRFPRI